MGRHLIDRSPPCRSGRHPRHLVSGPTAFDFPANLSQPERRFAFREARLGLGGVLASLDTLWVNHPNRASDAIYKPMQLHVAAQSGLAVPRTLVTNDAAAVRRFHAESGPGLVCKVFGSNTITEQDTLKVAYTHQLDETDLADLSNVESTAHQFQDWVDGKHHEARVVVVGDRIFPVLIHAGSPSSKIDWRTDYAALRYAQTELPRTVDSGVRRYMTTFGLAYAAFDFAIDTAGRWFFLEANTAGQYGFLETNTGAPISAAMAELLAGGAS